MSEILYKPLVPAEPIRDRTHVYGNGFEKFEFQDNERK